MQETERRPEFPPRRRRGGAGGLSIAALVLVGLAAAAVDEAQAQGRMGRRRPQAAGPATGFDRVGPDLGDRAPDFVLQEASGDPVQLSQLWSRAPLLLVLGSYTSPEFRDHVGKLRGILESYPGRVGAAVLYTVEAHPSGSASPYGEDLPVPAINGTQGFAHEQPADLDARLDLARLLVKKLRIEVPVLVDGMDNAAWKAYGPAPNNAFLIDRHGTVVDRQGWFNPPAMRRSIETLLAVQPGTPPDTRPQER